MKATSLFSALALTLVSVGIQAQSVELDIERSVKVEFNSEKGYSYNVYGTSDPAKKTGWKLLGGEDGTGENIVFFYRTESDQKIFFRVESEPSEPGEEPKPQEPVQSVIPITGLPPAESSGTYNLAQAIGENEIGGVYRIGVSAGTDGVVIVLPHPGQKEYRQKQIKLSIYRGGTGLGSGKVSLKVRTPAGDAYESRKLVDNTSKQLTGEVVILPATALESGRKVVVDLFNDTAQTDGAAGGQWVVSISSDTTVVHEWSGPSVRLKNPDGSWGGWVNLTGATGAQGQIGPKGGQGPVGEIGPKGDEGPQGPIGERGLTGSQGPVGPVGPRGQRGSIEYEWDGTSLRFKNSDDSWSDWVDLGGAQGQRGQSGKDLEFEWSGSRLRTRVEGGAWSKWNNLQGTTEVVSSQPALGIELPRPKSKKYEKTIEIERLITGVYDGYTFTNSSINGEFHLAEIINCNIDNSSFNVKSNMDSYYNEIETIYSPWTFGLKIKNSTISDSDILYPDGGSYLEEITDSTLSYANIGVVGFVNLSGTKIHDSIITISGWTSNYSIYLNLNGAELKNSKFYVDGPGTDISDYVGVIYRIQNFTNDLKIIDASEMVEKFEWLGRGEDIDLEGADLSGAIIKDDSGVFVLKDTIIDNATEMDEESRLRWEIYNSNKPTYVNETVEGTLSLLDISNKNFIDVNFGSMDMVGPDFIDNYYNVSLDNCTFIDCDFIAGLHFKKISNCTFIDVGENPMPNLDLYSSYNSILLNSKFINCVIDLISGRYQLAQNCDFSGSELHGREVHGREGMPLWGQNINFTGAFWGGVPPGPEDPDFFKDDDWMLEKSFNIISPNAEILKPKLIKYAAPATIFNRKLKYQITYASESELTEGTITFKNNGTYSLVRNDSSTESGSFIYEPNGSTAYLQLIETKPDIGTYEKHAVIFTKSNGGMFGGKTADKEDGVVSGEFELVD